MCHYYFLTKHTKLQLAAATFTLKNYYYYIILYHDLVKPYIKVLQLFCTKLRILYHKPRGARKFISICLI